MLSTTFSLLHEKILSGTRIFKFAYQQLRGSPEFIISIKLVDQLFIKIQATISQQIIHNKKSGHVKNFEVFMVSTMS